MIRISIFFLLLSLFCACADSAEKQEGKPPAEPGRIAANGAVTFQFSTAAAIPVLEKKGNWCRSSFPDAVLINADPANFNRRFFRIDQGVYKVGIQLGTTIGTFMLRDAGRKKIDLFTSKNFPECLSSLGNFTLSADASEVTYDNRHYIHFTVDVQQDAGGLVVFLEFPPGSEYGMSVHRCADCR